jgi:hypothetical protein
MPFITFIYKIGKNQKTYYGKCMFDYVSDEHEGLDNEVRYKLIKGINKYRKNKNMKRLRSKIMIGIMSFSSNSYVPVFSTNDEIKCFDFYCDYKSNIYMNGKLV